MKVLVVFAFMAVAGVMSQSAVTYSASVGPDQAPRYGYAYHVNDPTTGDIKEHHEVRDGDVVSGSYSVVEADGTKRIVDYTADEHHGFNANVRHEDHEGHEVVPVVPKVVAQVVPKVVVPVVPKVVVPVVPKAVAPVVPEVVAPVDAKIAPYFHVIELANQNHAKAYPYADSAYTYPYPYATSAHAYPYANPAYAYPYYTPYSYPHTHVDDSHTYPYVTTTSYAY